jgi:hypothetical protein
MALPRRAEGKAQVRWTTQRNADQHLNSGLDAYFSSGLVLPLQPHSREHGRRSMDPHHYNSGQQEAPAAYIPREMFSVGGVIGLSFTVWLKNFLPFALIALLCHIPVAIWIYTKGIVGADQSIGLALLASIINMLCSSVTTAAITYGVVMSLRKTPASFGDCVSKGLSRMLPSIAVGLVMGVCVGLGLVALVIPGIIILCMLYVAVPASVIEAPGVGGALSRSAALTKGHRLGIFALAILLGAAAYGIAWLNLNKVLPWLASGATSLGGLKMKFVAISMLQTVVLATLGACFAAVAYYLLRSEKEGVNIDQIGSVFD